MATAVTSGELVSLTVLDVGHGSCAYISAADARCIIDGGSGNNLLRLLRAEQIAYLDLVLISHADLDHIRGLRLALRALPDLVVGTVLVNPDQDRDTKEWKWIVEHLEARQERHGTILGPLTADLTDTLVLGSGPTQLKVLSPMYSEILTRNNSNRTSAVVKLIVDQKPCALITADMDARAFSGIVSRQANLSATVLVFPHHGGKAATGDLSVFGEQLVSAVSPDITLISLGRNMFGNPHPQIVAGIRQARSATHIACTQLSKGCSAQLPAVSLGANTVTRHDQRCVGSVVFDFAKDGTYTSEPTMQQHREFLNMHVPERLCS